jgi:integrase
MNHAREPFFRELNELFQRHGHTAARSGKEVSFGTYHIRRAYLFGDFYKLRTGKLVKLENGQEVPERRFKLPSPYSLKQKHIKALVADWVARGHSVAYFQNKLSVWRVLCTWIGKPDLIPPIEDLVADPAYHRRSQVALRDKSWSGCGIDVMKKIQEIAGTDARIAMVLELMLVFSLRLKEAALLRPHQADQKVFLDVKRGTKNGRHRVHRIMAPEERAVLERAKALVTDRTGCLIPPDKTYKWFQNQVYFVLKKHGVTHEKAGTSTHGLRHEGLNKLYEEIAGAKSPVQGGKKGEVDPATDRFARAIVADAAGHSRISKAGMYLGAVVRGHKPATEIGHSTSPPESTAERDDAAELVGALGDPADSDEEIS